MDILYNTDTLHPSRAHNQSTCFAHIYMLCNMTQDNQSKTNALEDRIAELQAQATAESHSRRMLEAQHAQEKRESDLRHREALAQVVDCGCNVCSYMCRLHELERRVHS